MTISVVQADPGSDLADTCTMGAGLTLGNWLLILAAAYNTTAYPSSPEVNSTAITPTSTYQGDNNLTGSSNVTYTIWLTKVSSAMAGQTALSFDPGTSGGIKCYGIELSSPADLTFDVESPASGTGTGGSVTAGPTAGAAQSGELAVFLLPVFGGNPSVTGGGFTIIGGENYSAAGYQTLGSSGSTASVTATVPSGDPYACGIVLVKLAAGAHTGTATLTATPDLTADASRTPAARTGTATMAVAPGAVAGGSGVGSRTATASLAVAPVMSAAGSLTRDKYTWPFAWDSIWNLPISDAATYAATGVTVTSDYSTQGDACEANSVSPSFPVKTLANSYTGAVPVHCDPDMTGNGEWNSTAAFLSTDGDTIWQGQTLQLTAGGSPDFGGQTAYLIPGVSITGDGIIGAHGGSYLSCLGGTLTVADLTGSGPIRHAMKVLFNGYEHFSSAGAGYQWPASNADFGFNIPGNVNFYGGSNTHMVEGALLALPPSVNPLTKYSDPLIRRIGAAMQDYGCYIVDNTAAGAGVHDAVIELNYDAAAHFNGSGTFSSDFHQMLMDLQVVTNSTESTPGGGAIGSGRRAAYAPAFGDAEVAADAITGYSGTTAANKIPGSTLFYCIYSYGSASTSVTSIEYGGVTYTNGDAYGTRQLLAVQGADTGDMFVSVWMLPNISASSDSVAVTVAGGTPPDDGLTVVEVPGLGPAPWTMVAVPGGASGDADTAAIGPSSELGTAPAFVLTCAASYYGFSGGGPATGGWVNAPGGANYQITSYQLAADPGSEYSWSEGMENPGLGYGWAIGMVYAAAGTPSAHTATAALAVAPAPAASGTSAAAADYLTYDPALSRVRVSLSAVRAAIGVDDTAVVQRSPDKVRWTTVRGGSAVQVTASALPLDDYEFAPDALNYYRVVPSSNPEQDDSITPDLAGQWWLKHIRYPFLNMIVSPSDVGDVTRPSVSGTFNIVGSSLPVVVSLPRASAQWTLTVATADLDELAALNALLATGDVLLLQVPAGSIIAGGYFAAGDTAETRNTVPTQRRWVTIPLTEAKAPDPAVTGATAIWQTVVDSYATWYDLVAAQPTWDDVLSLVGSPADVVVS